MNSLDIFFKIFLTDLHSLTVKILLSQLEILDYLDADFFLPFSLHQNGTHKYCVFFHLGQVHKDSVPLIFYN